jgi:hypothetical protein
MDFIKPLLEYMYDFEVFLACSHLHNIGHEKTPKVKGNGVLRVLPFGLCILR